VDLSGNQPVERTLDSAVLADGLAALAGDDDGDVRPAVDMKVLSW
jgi:hypothetical protein